MDLVIGIAISLLITSFILWVAMAITGVRAALPAVLVIAAAVSVPNQLIPNMMLGVLVATILMWILMLKLTSAEGFVDVLLVIVITNIFSNMTAIALMKHVMDKSPSSKPNITMERPASESDKPKTIQINYKSKTESPQEEEIELEEEGNSRDTSGINFGKDYVSDYNPTLGRR